MGRVRVLRQPLAVLLGLRLHPIATLGGLPIAFALTGRWPSRMVSEADTILIPGRSALLLHVASG